MVESTAKNGVSFNQGAYELTSEVVQSVRENLEKYYADLKEVMVNV